MSKNYDNWEKLVGAVLKREQFRLLARRSCSSLSDDVSSFFSSRFDHQLVVCKGQKSESDSFYQNAMYDAFLWDRFLFPDQDHHPQTVPRSVIGKVVFLPIEARELTIRTEDPKGHLPFSFRYYDAVEVDSVLSVDIRGKIRARLLTSKTIYGVYLVYTLEHKSMGFETAKGVIRFVDDETDEEAERRAGIVHLQAVAARDRQGEMAVSRGDGWMEVEIGSFYVENGGEGEVEARVVETSSRRKGGLIVEGMEFRPLVTVKQL